MSDLEDALNAAGDPQSSIGDALASLGDPSANISAALAAVQGGSGEERQPVRLEGGSFDGYNARAPLPPRGFRVIAQRDEERWSELYLYANKRTAEDPELGTIPVMLFQSRGEIEQVAISVQ
jgi:hypothetical protein